MVLVIMKGRKFKIFKMYHQAGYQGKSWYFSSSPKTVCWHISLLLREVIFFFFGLVFSGWFRHIVDGSMLCSKFINLHVTLKHILPGNIQNKFWPCIWTSWPSQAGTYNWNHKFNYHQWCHCNTYIKWLIEYIDFGRAMLGFCLT